MFFRLFTALIRLLVPRSCYAKAFGVCNVLFYGGISSGRQFITLFRKPDGAKPLKNIPDELLDDFTQGGKIPVQRWFIDNRASFPVRNTKEKYASAFSRLDNRTFKYYGKDMLSFYNALNDYDLSGKTALILGLAGCNCDAMALWKKAKRVVVSDYNKPVCEHENVTVLSMEEMRGGVKSGDLRVDCAFSFSSFEHDGLGRYGDPISPDADIRAMEFAGKAVKEDGILFLGVPLGQDCLVWNAQRIYGKIRLRLLLKDWLCLDAYYHERRDFFTEPLGFYYQPLLVLQNTRPTQEKILDRLAYSETLLKQEKKNTRSGELLGEVLRIQRGAA
ncbi:hypothetical protein AGMMS50276_09130 [Synergistales bacterium]|nr:hypothetical protein AGMMS50276_09130 [Synergistales bacterium]